MSTVRPNVLAMHPYSPGKPIDEVKRELGIERVIKLASNENPFGPSPKAVQALREAADQLHLYPDGSAYDLRSALAQHYSVPRDQVIVGNGSDEIIHLLGLVFLSGGHDEMVVGDPSFVRYDAAAQLADSRLVKVPLDGHLKHDLVAMAAACTERTKLLFIANPNNPTGTVVSRADVDRLLESIPEHVVVVLDEAYYEFAADIDEFPNSLDYVRAGRNVIGMRTFSKAYGLAGLRLGYAFVPEFVHDAIDRAREPFNVNSLAQVAGIAALNDQDHVRQTVAANQVGLETLAQAFRAVGAKPYQSFANFVLADMGRPADPIFEALLKEGIITRSGRGFGAPNSLRVSVGTPAEVDAFVAALKRVCALQMA